MLKTTHRVWVPARNWIASHFIPRSTRSGYSSFDRTSAIPMIQRPPVPTGILDRGSGEAGLNGRRGAVTQVRDGPATRRDLRQHVEHLLAGHAATSPNDCPAPLRCDFPERTRGGRGMGWNPFSSSGNDDLLETTRQLVRLLQAQAESSGPHLPPDPVALEAGGTRLAPTAASPGVSPPSLCSPPPLFSALVVGISRASQPTRHDLRGVSLARLPWPQPRTPLTWGLITLVISATALVASVHHRGSGSPFCVRSASTSPTGWPQRYGLKSASVAAFLLAAVSSGMVILALFRSSSAEGGGAGYLAPLAIASSFLAVMTTTRAQDEAAVASTTRTDATAAEAGALERREHACTRSAQPAFRGATKRNLLAPPAGCSGLSGARWLLPQYRWCRRRIGGRGLSTAECSRKCS